MKLGTSLTAGNLRVVFQRRADRWGHVIERLDNGVWQHWLTSIEGDASDDWPPSPPFQELHASTLGDGRGVIFLVGRAGTSHWSASIETAGETLVFDIACRHSRAAEKLGSAYLIETRSVSEGEVEAHAGTKMQRDGESLRLEPVAIGDSVPCTTRWKYAVHMVGA